MGHDKFTVLEEKEEYLQPKLFLLYPHQDPSDIEFLIVLEICQLFHSYKRINCDLSQAYSLACTIPFIKLKTRLCKPETPQIKEFNQMVASTCPYCSHRLLRQVRSRRVYWFCSHCYQEIPYPAQSIDPVETTLNLSDYSDSTKKVNTTQKTAFASS